MKDEKFEYFKKEILKVLNNKKDDERKELKKSFLELEILNKAKLPIGYVSTYKDGSQWRKVDNNKSKCIRQARAYSTESKGAKIALKTLIKKVENATTTDELLDVVMFNINRFQDENGMILPIVEELKTAVDVKKVTMSPEKKAAFDTLNSFVNKKNFDEVKGKSRDEIFAEYDNTQKAIAIIPIKLSNYGLKNEQEMVAEIANPLFRDGLKKINLFSKLISGISKLFRKEQKNSENIGLAYEKIKSSLYKIIDNYNPNFTEDFESSDMTRQAEPRKQEMIDFFNNHNKRGYTDIDESETDTKEKFDNLNKLLDEYQQIYKLYPKVQKYIKQMKAIMTGRGLRLGYTENSVKKSNPFNMWRKSEVVANSEYIYL